MHHFLVWYRKHLWELGYLSQHDLVSNGSKLLAIYVVIDLQQSDHDNDMGSPQDMWKQLKAQAFMARMCGPSSSYCGKYIHYSNCDSA